MNPKFEIVTVRDTITIWNCLTLMDDRGLKLFILVNSDNKYKGLISIGDLQREIIKGTNLEQPVTAVEKRQNLVATPDFSLDEIKALMFSIRAEFMPVIDDNNEILEIYFWKDLFGTEERVEYQKIDVPVIIMAGGKGTRLKPLTNVIPKPLIPIGENTIIEEIINRFTKVGCTEFYLSVNYKASTIKHYFEEKKHEQLSIDYFQETKPLGTAGSMFLIKNKINTTFFVSNCDILIDQDLSEIYHFHKSNNLDITIVSALKNLVIPYGTIQTGENGKLISMSEKPSFNFQINTGVYILEPHVLESIPENAFFHITDLIEEIRNKAGRVGVFPISEGSWTDIGEWDVYTKYLSKLGYL